MHSRGLSIHLYSIHGLIRGENLELGRDADTGGQVTYVSELIRALGRRDDVRKVSLFTRLITDKTVSPDYSQQIEQISDKVRIVRIPCGGKKYIRKELLWPHLDEFVDKTLKFVKEQDDIPDVVHGHYADAGYVAMELATFWGVPLIFTGHSLGRVKKSDLREKGVSEEEMEKKFHIDQRILVEEEVMRKADMLIASTRQETQEQYGLYPSGEAGRFSVIPPGIDIERFYPFYDDPIENPEEREQLKWAKFYAQKELERFFLNQEKPLIFALARPDHRKNISGLIEAYGKDKELQAIANLAVFAGIRKDITTMNDSEGEVLTELLLLMDKFDLYGKLAIPKRHDVEYEVPELYRLTATTLGVFVNPAFKENFGMTLIEAAASGLPIVATNTGGPYDIITNCQNGILVDVTNHEEMTGAIKKILVDQDLWKTYSQNGIQGAREHYTWDAHTQKYLKRLQELLQDSQPDKGLFTESDAIGKKFAHIQNLFFTDIDETLIGDEESLETFKAWLQEHRKRLGFGVVTGRPLESACAILDEHEIPHPDIIISSVGTEIVYGADHLNDKGWGSHISLHWQRENIVSVLSALPFLELQDESAQRPFKISYYMDPSEEHIAEIHQALSAHRLRYMLIYSVDSYLDILPYRASKGKAIRYLSYKWNIPLKHILVAGSSETDEDMLRGEMCGVVVGSHNPGLEQLKGLRHVYFSSASYAAGILEGIAHYHFPSS